MKEELQKKNPKISIFDIKSSEFSDYGKVVNFDTSDLVQFLPKKNLLPEEGNTYTRDNEELKKFNFSQQIKNNNFGEMEIQAGFCNGFGNKMNAFEWHKSPEIIVAGTPLVLILGKKEEMINGNFSSKKAKLFYMESGQAVELLPEILHFAPIRVKDHFKAAIYLFSGTNMELSNGINGMLRAKNKWMIVHKDFEQGIKNGGRIGIIGDNISIECDE